MKSLLNMVRDLPQIREEIIAIFCEFILIEINDSWEQLIEESCSNLILLVDKWTSVDDGNGTQDYSIILDRLDGFAVLLLASSSLKVRQVAIRLLKAVLNLSERLNCQTSRLYSILSEQVVCLKSLIEQFAGAKAEDWRNQLNVIIQLIWSKTVQATPVKKTRTNSMMLFFVFMDSFERIKNGPWESMTSPTGVSFIGSQRNRALPTATGYLQQWGHYLLIGKGFVR